MITILVVAFLGRLLIYLAQNFPFQKFWVVGKLWDEDRFFGKLFGCDLCLGVWIYWGLSILTKINIYAELGYIPFLSEFLTGATISFVVHLVRIGWNSKFSTIVVDTRS